MMRPMPIAMAPKPVTDLKSALGPRRLTWTDNSTNEVSFRVETNFTGPWTTVAVLTSNTGSTINNPKRYPAAGALGASPRYYRVVANNVVGDTAVYPAPALGFPTISLDSTPSNIVRI